MFSKLSKTPFFFFLISLFTISLFVLPNPSLFIIPRTDSAATIPTTDTEGQETLNEFIGTVINDSPDQMVGLYVADKFAYPIIQQPEGSPAYVSTTPDVVTQFGAASQFQSIGILAHNFLAGNSFFQLTEGDFINLIYGDGSIKYYWVYEIKEYQALSPTDPYSKFIDLDDTTRTLSSTDVFQETYGLGIMVLQTCIQVGNESSWGRRFVLAIPVSMGSDGLINQEFNMPVAALMN